MNKDHTNEQEQPSIQPVSPTIQENERVSKNGDYGTSMVREILDNLWLDYDAIHNIGRTGLQKHESIDEAEAEIQKLLIRERIKELQRPRTYNLDSALLSRWYFKDGYDHAMEQVAKADEHSIATLEQQLQQLGDKE